MKRNEELIVGEKIVAVPFFFEKYSIYSVFELLQQCQKQELIYRETNGFGEFFMGERWLVCNSSTQERLKFMAYIQKCFEEADYEQT